MLGRQKHALSQSTQARNMNPNPNFGSGYPPVVGLLRGGGLPREGVGAEKFGMSLETRETNIFWRDIPGFCRDILVAPEKFEKKGLCSIFVS